MEIDMSMELEKDNCLMERKQAEEKQRIANLLQDLKANKTLACHLWEIEAGIRRQGADFLLQYAVCIASDVPELSNFLNGNKANLLSECNEIKACILAYQNYLSQKTMA